MNEKNSELLNSIDQMIEDAPKLGLCPVSFHTLRKEVEALINRAETAEIELRKETGLRMFFERAVHQGEKSTIALDKMTPDNAMEIL